VRPDRADTDPPTSDAGPFERCAGKQWTQVGIWPISGDNPVGHHEAHPFSPAITTDSVDKGHDEASSEAKVSL
jgi:hypothetical protein